MVESEREQFGTLIQAMAATFRRECDEPMVLGYWLGLSDLPINLIAQAVGRAIRECKFCPSVFELRELAGCVTKRTRAVLAWQTAVASLDYYRTVDFEDRRINAVIHALGGWCGFCEQSDNPAEFDKWTQQRFLELYDRLDGVNVHGEQCAPCEGYFATAVGCHDREATEQRNPARFIECEYRESLPELAGNKSLPPVVKNDSQRLLKSPDYERTER